MNLVFASILIAALLLGPVLFAPLERNIEIFFLAIGLTACALLGDLSWRVAAAAASEPILITAAVLVAGVLFELGRGWVETAMNHLRTRIPVSMLAGGSILLLAFLSSLITAIVAAIILARIVRLLHLDRNSATRVAVAGCFAIGFGSAMTPIGEPLATLAAAALKLPFHGLFLLMGAHIIPAVVVFSILAGFFAHRGLPGFIAASEETLRGLKDIPIQGVKIYIFIAGLVLIGHAFTPLSTTYLTMLDNAALYWLNTISAILDNATLVALELHGMNNDRAREAIIALLCSGGMLIPGNVPNIITAASLRISSLEWAKTGVPVGMLALVVYFFLLFCR